MRRLLHLLPATSAGRAGFALPTSLAVLILMSMLVATAYATSMAAYRTGSTDLGKLRSHFAAEAGAESALAQLADALEDAVIEDRELDMIVAPTMTGFVFDSFSAVKVGAVVPERITDGPFAGLYSLTQVVDVHSEASGPGGHSSAVVVTAKAQAIPIFQFGVFYDKDLEITNGPRLDFAGWVHSNGNIYLSSDNQYFQDIITTPNRIFHDRKDRHEVLPGVHIRDAAADDVQLTFDSRDTPDPNDFRAKSAADFDSRLQTEAHGVDSLNVPLPAGVDPLTVMQPREAGDGALEKQAKFAWKADWNLRLPLAALSDPADLCEEMVSTRDDPTQNAIPTLAQCQNIFTLTYDAWYEGREQRFVDVLDVDLAQLFAWAGSDSTRITNIMYFSFEGTTPDPRGDGDYPIVRLRNGSWLGNPITFATEHPLYIEGDYNAVGWQPSALVGDAITFLSDLWTDSDHQTPTQIRPGATGTAIYAAILAGHSGTPCDHEDAGCPGFADYGGGLENFPRFLEDWDGRTLLYRGSLVSLSNAQQATGLWGNGPYYRPPNRNWEFDTRFEDPANLPPGTPVVGNVVHTAFRPIS